MAEHCAKHCLTSSSKDLRTSEARLGGVHQSGITCTVPSSLLGRCAESRMLLSGLVEAI